MALVVPINQVSAWFSAGYELDSASYTLTFRWNERIGIWVMDLGDVDDNVLAAGSKVVVNTPLLRGFRTLPGLPPGELFVRDTQGLDADPGFEDLGRRARMIYLTGAEVTGG